MKINDRRSSENRILIIKPKIGGKKFEFSDDKYSFVTKHHITSFNLEFYHVLSSY